MLERVVSRRGKFSPGEQARPRGKLQGIVPLPVTGNNRNIYDQAEGLSRASSPTIHLRQIYVPTPPISRKRKSITRKLLESFRESPRSNDQIFAEYVKNKLIDGNAEERLFNNMKVERMASRIMRRNSQLKSFIANSFRQGTSSNKNNVKQISQEDFSHCKYRHLGCTAQFSHYRPQVRLQHESCCSFMLVRCQWGEPDCGQELALQDLHRHLVEEHGHTVVQLEQEEGEDGLCLTEELKTDCWPDNSGSPSSPSVVMISALGHTFLLFTRNKDKMRDDHELSVCLLGPPKLATRFAYELRLLDEVGFAYRGPMLSATVEREQFWAQGYHLHIPNLEVLGSFFETCVKIFYRE